MEKEVSIAKAQTETIIVRSNRHFYRLSNSGIHNIWELHFEPDVRLIEAHHWNITQGLSTDRTSNLRVAQIVCNIYTSWFN
jgi:hypothetical protein